MSTKILAALALTASFLLPASAQTPTESPNRIAADSTADLDHPIAGGSLDDDSRLLWNPSSTSLDGTSLSFDEVINSSFSADFTAISAAGFAPESAQSPPFSSSFKIDEISGSVIDRSSTPEPSVLFSTLLGLGILALRRR